MLQRLHIQNYALIEQLDMELFPGFTVITGETGAGKSIILGALNLILGARTDVKAIKSGAKRCVVEAIFNLDDQDIEEDFFQENNLDFDENECILRRELTDTGKSRAFINDTPVTVSLLKELGSRLIDIHSQHQNLLLNKKDFQLEALDTIADDKDLKGRYTALFHSYVSAIRQLNEFKERVAREQKNIDFLQFQLNEIEEAHLDRDEQADLEEEANILNNAEEIKQGLYEANEALTTEENGIIQQLSSSLRNLRSISDVFPKAQELAERIDSSQIELEDIANELAREIDNIHFDPNRQTFVNERLSTIYSLEKKHQKESIGELLDFAQQLKNQLGNLQDSDDTILRMERETSQLRVSVFDLGKTLSTMRHEAIGRVEEEMRNRLTRLGMPNIQFCVELTTLDEPTEKGIDNVRFLFSANKNVPLQDIVNIASGGEIARVMLSLKALLTSRIQLPTIIFDEIDTGVSGQMAEKMALMMKEMSHGNRQIISITHLPQIAACGEYHYKVYKEDNEQGTATHICELQDKERITEIAHMLSGSTLTDAAINNAKVLLTKK